MHRNQAVKTMKVAFVFGCAWVVLLALSGRAAEPAVTAPARPEGTRPDQSLTTLCQKAQALEAQASLAQAEEIYREIIRRCDPDRQWELRRSALHGLRRVEALRAEFNMTRAELEKKLAETYRDYQPQEFGEWERRGWIFE